MHAAALLKAMVTHGLVMPPVETLKVEWTREIICSSTR